MGIEDDIQQAHFRNDSQKAMINLIYSYNWVNETMSKVFFSKDITAQQFNILRILRGAKKPLSTLQIRHRMLDRMSDTSRIVDRLLKKELVTKTVCDTDKRLVDISISEAGMQLLANMDEEIIALEDSFTQLDEGELKQLNFLLDKLRERHG
jgi:DNA-binding MarR family transcriptional regulator